MRRNRVVEIDLLADLETLSVLEESPDAAEQLSHAQELALLSEATAQQTGLWG